MNIKNKSINNIGNIYKNQNDIKNNNNILNNYYNSNSIKKESLCINSYLKKPKSEYRKNLPKYNINTESDLQKELKKFNLRYNNIEFLNDKNLLKNRVKSKTNPKIINTKQSCEYYKLLNLKKQKNKHIYKSNSYKNNCNIS